MVSSAMDDPNNDNVTYSCVNLYFMCQDGSTFKAQVKFAPYFYLGTKENTELEVDSYLRRRYEGQIASIEIMNKEDLDLENHLSGLQRKYLKISFNTVQELMSVKSELLPLVERNRAKLDAAYAYGSLFSNELNKQPGKIQDYVEHMLDLREYDAPHHVRFAIDRENETRGADDGHMLGNVGIPTPRPPRMYCTVLHMSETNLHTRDSLNDKQVVESLCQQVKAEIEAGISYLLNERNEDACQDFVPRILYEKTWGKQAPTFKP